MEIVKQTGHAVRRQRILREVSLRELARRLQVSPGTVSALENGHTRISLDRLQAVAAALDVPLGALIDAEPFLPAQAATAAPTVPADTGRWRDFAPMPIDPVLAGAIQAFVATGYHGASMRSIASAAEMSVPGVYHHYASKQDLLAKILDLTMGDLTWRLDQALEEAADPVDRLFHLVEALALFHARRNKLSFIGASEMRSLDPTNYRRIARLRTTVQGMLDQQIAAVIGPESLTAEHARDAGKAIATMCTSLAQWFHPDGLTTPEQIAIEYAEFALGMLGLSHPR